MQYMDNEPEVPFGFDELFFSRTDHRGKLRSGNEVFRRVSRYEWDELIGRPHNVIRHPDMPRAVFWLLWDRIRAGKPVGAYVKNRSKDGLPYWVYAIVTPISDGYLSVRLKPSSALFDATRSLYAVQLGRERELDLAPAVSAGELLERLRIEGFENYDAFMAASLLAELRSRNGKLDGASGGSVEFFEEIRAAADRLVASAGAMAQAYGEYRFVPMNLIIQAGQIGASGAAIGTISQNYSTLSDEIAGSLRLFMEAARQVSDIVREGAFLVGTAIVQAEMSAAFEKEAADPHVDHRREMACLDEQRLAFQNKASDNLIGVVKKVEDFSQRAQEMKRLSSGLAAIRVMGKVEAGRLQTGVLSDLIADLEAFQAKLDFGLSEIFALNGDLFNAISRLVEIVQSAGFSTPVG